MKRTILLAGIFGLSFHAANPRPAWGQVSESLTFAEALRHTRNQATDTKRALLDKERALLQREAIELEGDPRFSLQGLWGSRFQRRSRGAPETSVVRDHTYAATLNHTLLDFGRTSSNLRRSEALITAAELTVAQVEQDVFWLTARAYYSLVGASRLASLTRDQVRLAEGRLREQRRNYQQGLRPESDVVTAEVDLGRARLTAESAADDYHLASLRMLQLMGVKASSDAPIIVPLEGIVAAGPKAWQSWLETLPAREISVSERRLAAEKKALEAERHAIEAKRRPVLSGSLGAQMSTEREWTPLEPVYSGQLQMSWDVPWNGMYRNETAQILIRRREFELLEADQRDGLVEQEEIARQQIEAAAKMWTELGRQIDLVTKQQQLVRRRYMAGQASALDLSSSETALLLARVDQVRLGNQTADALLSLAQARAASDPALIEKL